STWSAMYVFDVGSGRALARAGTARLGDHLAFSPDGRFVAWPIEPPLSATPSLRQIALVGVDAGRPIVLEGLQPESDRSASAAFSPDSRLLAAADDSATVLGVFDVEQARLEASATVPVGFSVLGFSAGGEAVRLGGASVSLVRWRDGAVLDTWPTPAGIS